MLKSIFCTFLVVISYSVQSQVIGIHKPYFPKVGEKLKITLIEQRNLGEIEKLDYYALSNSGDTLLSGTILERDSCIWDEKRLHAFTICMDSLKYSDPIELKYNLHLDGGRIGKGVYKIQYYSDEVLNSELSQISEGLGKKQFYIVLVAENDTPYHSPEYLRKEGAYQFLYNLISCNPQIRKNWESFNFYIDYHNILNIDLSALVFDKEELGKYEYKSLDGQFKIMFLHKEDRRDKAFRSRGFATAEFNNSYSIIHELSHLIFDLFDEYPPDSISSFKKRFRVSRNLSNIFQEIDSLEYVAIKNGIDLECIKIIETDSLRLNEEKLKYRFYKVCDKSCIMHYPSSLFDIKFGSLCRILVDKKFQN